MKKSIGLLIAVMLAISIASVALARGAPTKQKAFTSKAAVESVSPTIVSAPVMTGYDVIENISEQRDLSIAQNQVDVVTTARRGLSTTVGWQSIEAAGGVRARSAPPNEKR